MSCTPLLHPSCIVPRLVNPVASTATNGFFNGLANAVAKAVRLSLADAATLWVRIPSPDLRSVPVAQIQGWLLPITAAVAAGAMTAAGLRMTLTRRANPLLDISGGLLTLAAAVTLGVVVPELLLEAGSPKRMPDWLRIVTTIRAQLLLMRPDRRIWISVISVDFGGRSCISAVYVLAAV
jgi:hypothetical protein